MSEVVVITGANSGLGLALVRSLSAFGKGVAGLDVEVGNLDPEAAVLCDVTDVEQVRAAVAMIEERWGRVDVLVNNACLAGFAEFEAKDLDDTRREMEVNYFGYVNMIAAVVPGMKARGTGVIHNVSSTVGMTGFGGIYGYASSKGAIEALTRTLALELRPYGIVVNILHPPLMRTPSAQPLGIPDAFMASPDDVARKLAPKIGSRRATVTPGLVEALGVLAARIAPGAMGRLMNERAQAARKAKVGDGGH